MQKLLKCNCQCIWTVFYDKFDTKLNCHGRHWGGGSCHSKCVRGPLKTPNWIIYTWYLNYIYKYIKAHEMSTYTYIDICT